MSVLAHVSAQRALLGLGFAVVLCSMLLKQFCLCCVFELHKLHGDVITKNSIHPVVSMDV